MVFCYLALFPGILGNLAQMIWYAFFPTEELIVLGIKIILALLMIPLHDSIMPKDIKSRLK